MRELETSDVWLAAMSAAITAGESPSDAAKIADESLVEFNKRWEWYSGGYGRYWKPREPKKGK